MTSRPNDALWVRLRTVVNWVNLSTPLGLLVAGLGGATVVRAERGLRLAGGYRPRFPVAGAFTIGSVVITRHRIEYLLERPVLLRHEDRHASQYGLCVGPLMLVPYAIAAGVSFALCGNHASLNPFERWAGLADGGYPQARGWRRS